MKLSTRFLLKGAFRVMRGSAKATAGRVSSNRWLTTKGRLERISGRVQWKVGKAEALIGM